MGGAKQENTRANMVLTDNGGQRGVVPATGGYMAGSGYMVPRDYPQGGQTQPWMQPAAQSQIFVSNPQYMVSQNVGPQMPPPVLQTEPISSGDLMTKPAVQPELVGHGKQQGESEPGQSPGAGSKAAGDNIPFYKVEVIQRGVEEAIAIEKVDNNPYIERLAQQVRARLSVPTVGEKKLGGGGCSARRWFGSNRFRRRYWRRYNNKCRT